MEAKLRLQDQHFRLNFSEATVHLEGEFAGNIDLVLSCSPPLPWCDLQHALRLSVPGETQLLDILGYLQSAERYDLTFFSEATRDSERAPLSIDAYWRSAHEQTHLGCLSIATAVHSPAPDDDHHRRALVPPELALGNNPPQAHPWDDPVVRRKANIRGCAALAGLGLLFGVIVSFVFPEVRSALTDLVDSILKSLSGR